MVKDMLLKNSDHGQVGLLESDNLRSCTVCLKTKQESSFHLKGTDKHGLARFQSSCKECANKNRMARYLKKKALKKPTKLQKNIFDITCCNVDIIYKNPKEIMTEVIADYVEASYAVSIKSSVIKAKN